MTDPKRFLVAIGTSDTSSTDGVLGWIAQVVLAQGPSAGMPLDQLRGEIESSTGLMFDATELRRELEKRRGDGISVSTHEIPNCQLSSTARELTLESVKNATSSEERIVSDWVTELSETTVIPDGAGPTELAADFRSFCERVAFIHGMEGVALVYGGKEAVERFVSSLDSDVWKTIPDRVPHYQDYCRTNFPRFFLQAAGSRAAFSANLVDRTYELCRLNLAPNTSKLLLSQLPGLTAYLDTNILFRLLGLHGPSAHLDVRRVLELSRQAKVELRVTPRTLEEFDVAANGFLRERGAFVSPPELYLKLDPRADDRIFFRDFHQAARASKPTEATLRTSLRNTARTLEAFGVTVRTDRVDETEKYREDVSKLSRELMDLAEKREFQKPSQLRKAVPWEKVEHDAWHIKLIEILRPHRVRNFAEARFWFLTLHFTLARAAARRAGPQRLSTTLVFEQWHQLLRSVLPRAADFNATFVRNIRSPLFASHRVNYLTAMEEISNRLVTYSSLTSEHFANIVADAAFAAKVAALAENGPSERIEELVTKLVDERVAVEAAVERAQRLDAQERLRIAEKSAEAASAEVAKASADLAKAEVEIGTLKGQIAEIVTQREAEIQRRVESRTRWHQRGWRTLGVLSAFAIIPVAVLGNRDGVVLGTPLHSVGVVVLLAGISVYCWDRRRGGAIAAVIGIILAFLDLSPQPTHSVTPAETSTPAMMSPPD